MRSCHLKEICFLAPDVADSGMPQWANLSGGRITSQTADPGHFGGGGVYACFWDGGLIYIGSFLGPRKAPFSGHVADRIYKHVMGFTLRAKSLGFGKRTVRSIIANLDHSIARDLRNAYELNDRLERGSIKATYNKARFAARHWEELRDSSPETLLERFSFTYHRIATTGNPNEDKAFLKAHKIKPIERRLIKHFQPICNTEFRSGPDGSPVRFDEVAEMFKIAFTQPLYEADTTATPPSMDSEMEPDEDDREDKAEILPVDPRWQEYYTNNGQLRARATLSRRGFVNGRTLLYRESGEQIVCLATVDRLAAAGIEARRVQRGPLVSSVTVNFGADPDALNARLSTVLELCLEELAGLS